MMLRIFIVLAILGSSAFPAAQIRDPLGEPAMAAANDAVVRGIGLAAKGRWEDARRAFERAIRWQPGLAVAHFNLGVVLGAMDRGEDAIAAYRETLNLSPRMTEALVNIGVELCKRNRTAEGLAKLERAVRLSPRFAPAQYNLGVALAGLGQMEQALAAFERAAALAPNDEAIRRALATTRDSVARAHRLRRLTSAARAS